MLLVALINPYVLVKLILTIYHPSEHIKRYIFDAEKSSRYIRDLLIHCVFRFLNAGRQSVDANSIVMQMTLKLRVVCFQTIY